MTKGNTPPRLYRSRKEQVIAGVSGGLSEYFNVDPILFRLLFIVLTFVDGIGVLIYLLLWITVPREDKDKDIDALHIHSTIKEKMRDMERDLKKGGKHLTHTSGRAVFALVLILIGVVALLSNLLPIRVIRFDVAWPVIVILIGLYLIFKEDK